MRGFLADLRREFSGYNGKRFSQDLMAGITVAAVALPLALAFGVSSGADAAAGLITAGLVMRNHREILSSSQRTEEGDVLSIRGHGKFQIDRLGPLTSKGRLSVLCRKYQ